jgi:hypothetical protein
MAGYGVDGKAFFSEGKCRQLVGQCERQHDALIALAYLIVYRGIR